MLDTLFLPLVYFSVTHSHRRRHAILDLAFLSLVPHRLYDVKGQRSGGPYRSYYSSRGARSPVEEPVGSHDARPPGAQPEGVALVGSLA
jgi:hypothetical protein